MAIFPSVSNNFSKAITYFFKLLCSKIKMLSILEGAIHHMYRLLSTFWLNVSLASSSQFLSPDLIMFSKKLVGIWNTYKFENKISDVLKMNCLIDILPKQLLKKGKIKNRAIIQRQSLKRKEKKNKHTSKQKTKNPKGQIFNYSSRVSFVYFSVIHSCRTQCLSFPGWLYDQLQVHLRETKDRMKTSNEN